MEDQSAVPRDCISLLDAGVKHATSSYGIVEKLNIARGYWRATNKSREIFKCFNEQACKGGIASKTSDYCMDGFKGPCRSKLNGVIDLKKNMIRSAAHHLNEHNKK